MGKGKKGFNWKAREIVQVSVDNHANKVKVEIQDTNQSYDAANPLILPSKKRKTVVKKPNVTKVKLLSKKQRKHYEKIVEKKKKKEERAALLKALSAVQGTPELLSKLTSVAEFQTKGRKRLYENCEDIPEEIQLSSTKKFKIRCPRRNRNLKFENRPKTTDPNVVGFDSSESEEDTESEAEPEKNSDIENNEEKTSTEADTPKCESDEVDDKGESKDAEKVSDKNMMNKEKQESEQNKELTMKNTSSLSKTSNSLSKTFVPVERIPELQHIRLKLPIIGEEQVIMEAINENDVVVIAGETGSGKTTQVPQFLYEAGYSLNGRMIGVTEPRRVAAISMSRRVGEELNLSSEKVSYLIRFEGNAGPNTQIKFMTDGVLLKEIQKDFLLSKYSAIILDEAHERSVFTDILIGLLSRITPIRRKRHNPLKLIIMSATLRLTDFTENTRLFSSPPPVIKVDSRQYPVTVHFNKRTAIDYVKEAISKACKIHTKLPEGGILIFVTGQREVNYLVKKLRRTFPLIRENEKRETESEKIKSESEIKKEEIDENEIQKTDECIDDDGLDLSDSEMSAKEFKQKLRKMKNLLPAVNLEDYATKPTEDEMELYETDDELEDDVVEESLITGKKCQPMWVLPLYSLLPSKKQAKVFEPPPEGCRLCVVATNVAETSLTIPHVKYVIDSGRTKVRLYDKLTGVSAFTVTWTSKASADQRAGRAGRTAAGHCYRLYSSAVFNDEFQDWSLPEIQRKPVDDLLLQMKSLKIDRVVNFPFPSPPDTEQLKSAERHLKFLGALKSSLTDEWNSKLTPLGESMAAFPVAPRFAKMLCLSQQFNLLPYTVAIVAALSVQEFLLNADDRSRKIWKGWAGIGNSFLLGDVMVLLRALGAAEHASMTKEGVENFCNKCGLRYKSVLEARKLRVQLTNELNVNVPDLDLAVDPKMPPPTDSQARQLRQIIMSGMADHVAYKLSTEELKRVGLSTQKVAYRMPELDDIIYLNSASVLKTKKPSWIVYQEVYQLHDKLYARGITSIEPEWLPLYAAPWCNISEPLKDPPPYFDENSGRVMCYISSTFGRSGWQLPIIQVEYPRDRAYGEDRFKHFAQFFLEGIVCPTLSLYVEHLKFPPYTMFKDWAKFLSRATNDLLKALIDKDVDSREKLLEQWKIMPNYLLKEYLQWLPESAHTKVKSLWPPVTKA